MKGYDLMIVLTGGFNEKGDLHPWVKKRLDFAVEKYKQYRTTILCSGGGTYHKPPLLDSDQYVQHESSVCSNYLILKGVDPQDLVKEWGSYDTIASIYFSLLLHIIPGKYERILVVTSLFHRERVKCIFDWLFRLYDMGSYGKYEIHFPKIENIGMSENLLRVREKREKESLEKVKELSEKMIYKKQFYDWFYKQHQAYRCQPFLSRESISDQCKQSY